MARANMDAISSALVALHEMIAVPHRIPVSKVSAMSKIRLVEPRGGVLTDFWSDIVAAASQPSELKWISIEIGKYEKQWGPR